MEDTDSAGKSRVLALLSVADNHFAAKVGAAADVAAEALRCVDVLRERLRKAARTVAGSPSRPRVLLLESVKPLTLGLLSLNSSLLTKP